MLSIKAVKAWFRDLFTFRYNPAEAVEEEAIRTFKVVKFPEGTAISCPKCNRILGIANRDIYGMEVKRSDAWTGIKPLTKLSCPHDDTAYVRGKAGGSELHTTKGWM